MRRSFDCFCPKARIPTSTPQASRPSSSLLESVRSEKMGELAAKFDSIHSIQRAVEVGSVSSIVAASDLRPYLVDAIERGMKRTADAEAESLAHS